MQISRLAPEAAKWLNAIERCVVGRQAKLLERILSGRSDANTRFSELVSLLLHLGFEERTKGDHHIFTMNGVEEILNL